MKHFFFLILIACSNVNTNEQAYYKEQKMANHGIVKVIPEVNRKNLPAPTEPQEKLGKEIYYRDCYQCHGTNGEGDGPMASKLNRKPVNLKETVKEMQHFDFYVKISQLEGNMPGWEKSYSDEERKAIVTYLKTLARD